MRGLIFGIGAIIASGVLVKEIINTLDSYDKEVENEIIKKSKKENKSKEINKLKKQIKQMNDELARLYDLKMLNDKRESTGQVSHIKLMVDGISIDDVINSLETNIEKTIKKYNFLRNS